MKAQPNRFSGRSDSRSRRNRDKGMSIAAARIQTGRLYSLAETMKSRAIGVILSGLGQDGADGLYEIIMHRGAAVVQDPTTCLGKEMPETALSKCDVDMVVSDREMAAQINNMFSFYKSSKRS